jgi:mono/diheme cytochrome c family protein
MMTTYRKTAVLTMALGFGLCVFDQPVYAAAQYPTDPVSIATGLELAEIHCATCHAVGREGESPLKDAPRFRNLGKRYPLEDLEESLAEGIVTAHDGMPEFAFAPEDIDAFLGYLTSIQSN